MSEENDSRDFDIRTKPVESLSVVAGGPSVVVADHCKVYIDGGCKLCTFVFFRRHPSPTKTNNITHLGQITDEVFLEVKMPFVTSLNLAEFISGLSKKMDDPNWNEVKFGPIYRKCDEDSDGT
jgi:hypothetical protein